MNMPVSVTWFNGVITGVFFTGNSHSVCDYAGTTTTLSYLLIVISQQRTVHLARASLGAAPAATPALVGWQSHILMSDLELQQKTRVEIQDSAQEIREARSRPQLRGNHHMCR